MQCCILLYALINTESNVMNNNLLKIQYHEYRKRVRPQKSIFRCINLPCGISIYFWISSSKWNTRLRSGSSVNALPSLSWSLYKTYVWPCQPEWQLKSKLPKSVLSNDYFQIYNKIEESASHPLLAGLQPGGSSYSASDGLSAVVGLWIFEVVIHEAGAPHESRFFTSYAFVFN